MANCLNKNGTNGNDELIFDAMASTGVIYHAQGGNDTIKLTGGSVTVYTDKGNNTIEVLGGSNHSIKVADTLEESNLINGIEVLTIDGADAVDAELGSGKDVVVIKNSVGRKKNGAYASIRGGEWGDSFTTYEGAANYQLYGENGNDAFIIMGGSNINYWGGSGNDTYEVWGGTNNKLWGGDSADIFNIYAANQNMVLGYGQDIVNIYAGDNQQIKANWGINTINLAVGSGHVITSEAGTGQDTLNITDTADKVTANLGDGSDNVYVSAGKGHAIYTEGWGDTIVIEGKAADSIFDAGSGNDNIAINGGSNIIALGGEGNDTLTVAGGNNISAFGGAGSDTLVLTGGADVVAKGGSGNDTYVITQLGENNAYIIDQAEALAADSDILQLVDYASDEFSYCITDTGSILLVHKEGGSIEIKNWQSCEPLVAFSDCTSKLSAEISKSGTYAIGPLVHEVAFSGTHLDVNLEVKKGLPLELDFSSYNDINLQYRYYTDHLTGQLTLELIRITSATSGYVYGTIKLNMLELEGPLHFTLAGQEHSIEFNEKASIYYDAVTNGYITIDNSNKLFNDSFIVYGNEGDDRIKATVVAGGSVYGGLGEDTINLDNGVSGLSVHGNEDNDTINLGYNTGMNNTIYGDEGNDTLIINGGKGSKIYGGEGDDLLRILYTAIDNDYYLDGGSGHNIFELNGGKGGQAVAGDDGNTVKLLGASNMNISLGSGDDVITYAAGNNNVVAAGAGNDTFLMENMTSANIYVIDQRNAALNDDDRVFLTSCKPEDFTYSIDEEGSLELINDKGAVLRVLGWRGNNTLDFYFANNLVSHKTINISSSGTYTLGSTTQKLVFSGQWIAKLESISYLPLILDFSNYNEEEHFLKGSLDSSTAILELELFRGTTAENAVRVGSVNLKVTEQNNITLLLGSTSRTIVVDGKQSIEYGSLLEESFVLDGSLEKYKNGFVVYGNGNDDRYSIYNGATGSIYAGSGNDNIIAENAGAGILYELGAGDDILTVTECGGDLRVAAGEGSDQITVCDSGDNNVIDAGAGNDTIIVAGGGGHQINILEGSNNVSLKDVKKTNIAAGYEKQEIKLLDSSDITLDLASGADVINVSGGSYIKVNAGNGNNVITAANSAQLSFFGGVDDNIIKLNSCANSQIETGNGNDRLELDSCHKANVNTYGGNDTFVIANCANLTLKAEQGIKNITLNNCSDGYVNLLAATQNIISLEGGSKMSLTSSNGNDTITISNGVDHVIHGYDGNDTFTLSGCTNLQLYGGQGNDTFRITSLAETDSYVIHQNSAGELDEDILDLSSFSSDDFYIRGTSLDYTLTHKNGGTIAVKRYDVKHLDKIIFSNETICSADIVERFPETATAVDVMHSFMASLDKTMKKGFDAVDEAIAACSLGKYSCFNDVYYEFKDCVKANSSNQYAKMREFLKEYCGIDMTNEDTGALTGADAGGAQVKTKITVVEEPAGITLDDFVIDYDSLGTAMAPDYSCWINGIKAGYDMKECYTKNVNGVTFYWNEDSWTDAVDRTKLEQIAGGVLNGWAEGALNLVEESYGLTLTDENSVLQNIPDEKAIQLVLEYNNHSGNLATVWSFYTYGSDNKTLKNNETLVINMYYYANGVLDVSGTSKGGSSLNLDMLLGHELTHAVMSANINSCFRLPKFVTEGLAELTIGIDNFRTYDIYDHVNPKYQCIDMSGGKTYDYDDLMDAAFQVRDTGFSDSIGPYAGGFVFWRYFTKQIADYSHELGLNYDMDERGVLLNGMDDGNSGVPVRSDAYAQTNAALTEFSDVAQAGVVGGYSVCNFKLDERGEIYITSSDYDLKAM